MSGDAATSVAGTVVLWAVSATIAVLTAFALTAGSLARRRVPYLLSRATVHVSRGVPTSLWVIGAGVGMLHLSTTVPTPKLFPGTPATWQPLAIALCVALALGSAGHLAEIFRSGRAAIGPARLEQATLMGLSSAGRAALIARECAPIVLPPTGSRLVHLLHNTAFVALFPVSELFGFVQARANQTFRVSDYVLLGALIYVVLSASIWLLVRLAEARLAPAWRPPRSRTAAP